MPFGFGDNKEEKEKGRSNTHLTGGDDLEDIGKITEMST
jgi:hypothetical protein